jgi:outer membrane protein OmpA-like peptidoglycan-associated protein
MKNRLTTLTIAALALALAGCASHPPKQNQTLVKAKSAVSEAASNPDVKQYAPVALQKAQNALNKAKSAGKAPSVTQHAYIALRRAQIAEAKAAEAQAKQTIKKSQKERKRIVKTAKNRKLNARKQQLKSQNEQIQQLKAKLADLHPKKTDKGIVLTLGDVLFAFDSAKLNSGSSSTLDRLASFLKQHNQDQVRIAGYTDSVGSASYNMKLSKERAASVKTAMMDRGINPDRMQTVGYGESNPVASNQTKSGRQQNRRVEFTILTGGQSQAQAGNGSNGS